MGAGNRPACPSPSAHGSLGWTTWWGWETRYLWGLLQPESRDLWRQSGGSWQPVDTNIFAHPHEEVQGHMHMQSTLVHAGALGASPVCAQLPHPALLCRSPALPGQLGEPGPSPEPGLQPEQKRGPSWLFHEQDTCRTCMPSRAGLRHLGPSRRRAGGDRQEQMQGLGVWWAGCSLGPGPLRHAPGACSRSWAPFLGWFISQCTRSALKG